VNEPLHVYLNPKAGMGRAGERWPRVAEELVARGHTPILMQATPETLAQVVRERLSAGTTRLVAAGGDGTLRDLAAAMMAAPAELRRQATLGMAALGTSNSFLRPADADAWCGGVQVALDDRRAQVREVYEITTDGGVHHFLMNSSVGMIARGCQTFLDPPWWIRLLERTVGIEKTVAVYGAVNAFTHPPVRARVEAPDHVEEGRYSGITVLKHPEVAGGVVFRTLRSFVDGTFDVVCLSKVGAVRLGELVQQWAVEGPKDGGEVSYFQATKLDLEFPEPTLVEFDGEVVEARYARYRILPGALRVMGRGVGRA
jgi:diacylglycerol kinase family enzyme